MGNLLSGGRSGLVCVRSKESIVVEDQRLGEFSITLWCIFVGEETVDGEECVWPR